MNKKSLIDKLVNTIAIIKDMKLIQYTKQG